MMSGMVIWISTEDRIAGADGHCFQLQRRRIKKESGGEAWDTLGYYATLRHAAQACLDKALARGDTAANVTHLLLALERASDRIALACEGAMAAAAAAEFEGDHVPANLPAELFEDA